MCSMGGFRGWVMTDANARGLQIDRDVRTNGTPAIVGRVSSVSSMLYFREEVSSSYLRGLTRVGKREISGSACPFGGKKGICSRAAESASEDI